MKEKLLLLCILAIAFLFRFNNINWDNNFHLNPDERFLTMTAIDNKLPSFFVYGTLPLEINKKLSILINQYNYYQYTLLGRQLSALADIFIVLFIYKTVQLLEKKYRFNQWIKYWAAFFYAISVLPIQMAHFFTVDPFLNLFMFASFYFALKSSVVRSAILFGLAMACKASAIFILPINILLIALTIRRRPFKLGQFLVIYVVVSYLTLHLASPNYFASGNIFNPLPNPSFIDGIRQLSSFNNSDIWYPPGVQWIHKAPIIFSLVNLSVFGVGIPYFVLILIGVFGAISNLQFPISKNKNIDIYLMIGWVIIFFLYQSTAYVKSMRYFIFLYPFLAIFAAIGIQKVTGYKLQVIIVIACLIWPLAFSTIYLRTNTRVAASIWIYKNLPNDSLVLGEYWDDQLPLPVDNAFGKTIRTEQLTVFDPDTPEKWQRMDQMLQSANYYILSSNRGWGSIPTVPEKYPLMSKYYQQLFAGKTNYKLIKEFTSYPLINDSWAEEAFTVYDHPTVMVFRKQ